jgi:phage RecT family recombinase
MTAAAVRPDPATGMSLTRQKVGEILLADDAKKYIVPLLPHGITLERIMPTVHRAVITNPAILDCTPASIIIAVGDTVRWDLAIGETVHLVPFREKVSTNPDKYEKRLKAIRDYKGDIELVIRAGAARSITAQNVYANEKFVYEQGDDPSIEHHPVLDPAKRGPQLGAYAIARISHYMKKIVWLHVTEIEAVRQAHSKQWKTGAIPEWYGPKTCVHRVTKELPKNPKLAAVLHDFEEEEKIPDGEFEIVDETTVAAGVNRPAAGAPVTAAAEGGAVTPAPAATPESPAASEQGSDREAIAGAAPTGDRLATKEQIYDILDMLDHEAVPEHIREKIKTRIKTGLPANLASTWKQMLEEQIAAWHAGNKLDFAPGTA